MASKLELRFTSIGLKGATFTVNTGRTYTFKSQRLGIREVAIGEVGNELKPEQLAQNFTQAFQTDDNLSGEYTVKYSVTSQDELGDDLPAGQLHGIVTLEHFDNTHFDTYANGTGFITATLTTTTQESLTTLSAAISQADSNPCANYKLSVTTNNSGGKVIIEAPIGSKIAEYTTDGLVNDLELVRATNPVTGVIKLYETLESSSPEKIIYFNAVPVLSIINVDTEGSPFGASATINATPGITKTYSLNNVDFSGSPTFAGLLSGNFTAYVKDPYGCTKSMSFVITEDQVQGLTVPGQIEIPKHNAIPFFERSQNNILGQLSRETDNVFAGINVALNYLKEDTPRIQFRSSYPNHTAKIYGCGIEEELTIIQKSSNISKVSIYEGNYIDVDGRLSVYFTSGNIYNADGSPQDKGHTLNGFLPYWYKPGVYLKIDGIGVTRIERIYYDENNDAFAVTQLDGVGTVSNIKITSVHTEHPYEWFEFDIPLNRDLGEYIIEIDYGDGTYWSEVVRVNETLPKYYYKTSWRNTKQNDTINYSTGITPFRRIQYNMPLKLVGENEQETFRSEETVIPLNSTSTPVFEYEFGFMSMVMAWGFADGINMASEVTIEGLKFIRKESANYDSAGNWYSVKGSFSLLGAVLESEQIDYTQINSEFIKDVKFLKVSNSGFLKV